MKNLTLFGILGILVLSLSSCKLIGGIFKAGVWTGGIIVVVVLALIIFIIAKLFGGKK